MVLLTFGCFVIVATDGMCGKIAHFHMCKGTDDDMQYMLDMRDNLVFYVHLIDIYAPCIVGKRQWNDKANMMRYCGDSAQLFNDHVLSISDEAFLLVVLLNYTETWMSEVEGELTMVSPNEIYVVCFVIHQVLLL